MVKYQQFYTVQSSRYPEKPSHSQGSAIYLEKMIAVGVRVDRYGAEDILQKKINLSDGKRLCYTDVFLQCSLLDISPSTDRLEERERRQRTGQGRKKKSKRHKRKRRGEREVTAGKKECYNNLCVVHVFISYISCMWWISSWHFHTHL